MGLSFWKRLHGSLSDALIPLQSCCIVNRVSKKSKNFGIGGLLVRWWFLLVLACGQAEGAGLFFSPWKSYFFVFLEGYVPVLAAQRGFWLPISSDMTALFWNGFVWTQNVGGFETVSSFDPLFVLRMWPSVGLMLWNVLVRNFLIDCRCNGESAVGAKAWERGFLLHHWICCEFFWSVAWEAFGLHFLLELGFVVSLLDNRFLWQKVAALLACPKTVLS